MTLSIERSFTSIPQDSVSPVADGYGAKIGNLWVRLAASRERPLRYYTKDSLAPRQDDRGVTSENVLDLGYAWARTEFDGGEGLDWDPRELPADQAVSANDVRRFWDSMNIDIAAPPAGHLYATKLSKSFATFDTARLASVSDVAASSAHVFVSTNPVGDGKVLWYTSWNVDALVEEVHIPGGVKQLAVSQGDEVMVLSATGSIWFRSANGSTFTEIRDGALSVHPLGIWFVKGRFVACIPGQLGEVANDGTFTVFDTFSTAYEAIAVVSAGPSIVAAVTDGTLRSYVPEQANQADPDSVNLVIRGRTDMPKGETPSVLGANGSIITVLTIAHDVSGSQQITRFYRAEALSAQYDYVIGGLQLQREWFDSKEDIDVVSNMTTTRDAIWFAVTEVDNVTYLWRFDLVTFGLSRHSATFMDKGYAVTLFDTKTAIVSAKRGELWITSDSYHPYGYIISPNLTFGLNTDIVWLASLLESINVSTKTSTLELWITTNPKGILAHNHPSWRVVSRIYSDSQSGVEVPLVNVESRTLALQIRFFSHNLDTTPQLTRTAMRGFPSHRDWIVNMPVNVSDYYDVPYRQQGHIPGMGDIIQSQLLSMVGKHVELQILKPSLIFHGIVDAVEEPVEYITPRGSPSVYMMMQFRGERSEDYEYPTGDAGTGIGILGVSLLGTGTVIEPVDIEIPGGI